MNSSINEIFRFSVIPSLFSFYSFALLFYCFTLLFIFFFSVTLVRSCVQFWKQGLTFKN